MVAQQCRGETLRLVSSRSATTTTLWDRGGDTGHRMGHRSSWPHLEEVDEEVGVGGRLLVVEEEAPVEGGDQQGEAGEGLQAGSTSCRLVVCEGWEGPGHRRGEEPAGVQEEAGGPPGGTATSTFEYSYRKWHTDFV